jgi:D-lactate dehydrogenase
VLDGGARVRVKCGTILGLANRYLRRHGHALGPDPASTDIATVGGVIANNSGGMRCGITWDSYRTVQSMTLVLASGTVIDTAAPDAEERLAAAEPELARGLLELRDELRADPELAEELAASRLAPLAGAERLEPTLRAWLDRPGQIQAIAHELGVHPQTVRYRLRQLRDLFGTRLEDPEARFELALALRVD